MAFSRPIALMALPEEFANGPTGVGLSVASDMITDKSYSLPITSADRGRYAFKNIKVPNIAGTTEKMKMMYRLCALLCAEYGYYDKSSNVHTVDTYVEADLATNEEITACLKLVKIEHAVLILFSGKVTFYSTNHHIGTPNYCGYSLKVAMMIFPEGHELFKDMHYQIAHWPSTVKFYKKAGLPDIKCDEEWRHLPTPSIDVMQRLLSNPAGTATVFDVLEIIKKAMNSVFIKLVSTPIDLLSVIQNAEAIKKHPLWYHPGALFLTGHPQIPCEKPLEETMLAASAFLHAALPGSSMSRNMSLPKESEVKAHSLYINILKLRAGMVTQVLSEEKLKEMSIDIFASSGGLEGFKDRLANLSKMGPLNIPTPVTLPYPIIVQNSTNVNSGRSSSSTSSALHINSANLNSAHSSQEGSRQDNQDESRTSGHGSEPMAISGEFKDGNETFSTDNGIFQQLTDPQVPDTPIVNNSGSSSTDIVVRANVPAIPPGLGFSPMPAEIIGQRANKRARLIEMNTQVPDLIIRLFADGAGLANVYTMSGSFNAIITIDQFFDKLIELNEMTIALVDSQGSPITGSVYTVKLTDFLT